MSGGLLQLVAYGSQDIYLSSNASISFWKATYRRYTSFALEAIQNTFSGSVGWGKRVTVSIPRNGDLISTQFLEIVLRKHATNASYFPAEQFVKQIEVEIGGQKIDQHYNDWYRLFSEIYMNETEKKAYRRMTDFDNPEGTGDAGVTKRFFLPLQFFYNRAPGLALPLVALQYHEVRLNITFESSAVMEANGVDVGVDPEATLYTTYVYLDSAERKRFSQQSHEYLISVVQHTGPESVAPATSARTQNVRLNFNHPCKTLVWAIKGDGYGEFTTGANGTTDDKYAVLQSSKLQVNGHDRMDERTGAYYNQVQPYEFLKTCPSAGVYMYSFCLKPDEIIQPSGSINMSRIDNATLIVSTKAASAAGIANVQDENTTLSTGTGLTNLLVFAESFNVLRVISGIKVILLHLCQTARCHTSSGYTGMGKHWNIRDFPKEIYVTC
jgi:hypothetical protein